MRFGERLELSGIMTDLKREPLIDLGKHVMHYLFDTWFGVLETKERRYYLTETINRLSDLEDRELNHSLVMARKIKVYGKADRLSHNGIVIDLGTHDILSQIFPEYSVEKNPEGLIVMVTRISGNLYSNRT